MDPIHVICTPAAHPNCEKPTSEDIDAFYDEMGASLFVRLASMRRSAARLAGLIQRTARPGFAPAKRSA